MGKDKGANFTVNVSSGKVIVTDRTGASAEIYKEGDSYKGRDLTGADKLTSERQQGLLKRMVDWYFYNQAGKHGI